MSAIWPLQCPVQNYAWGKIGSQSTVAQLARTAVDERSAYAEVTHSSVPIGYGMTLLNACVQLWMGTHPNGPCRLATSQQLLKEALNSGNLSASVHSAFQGECPGYHECQDD
jgi:mannose-6-phosphate isomerase